MKKIIVIGGGAAGAKAASKAKRLEPNNHVELYTRDNEIAYSLCGLPYFIEGSVDDINKLISDITKQEKYNEAGEQYKMSAQMQKDPTKAAAAWHNLGNISSQAKDYAKSIEAYKQALRLNPNDDETRYNLVLAQKLLQEQQNQQNQDQEKDNQQQEENKDDQNKDQQNQPQQQDQNQQNQDEQNQQQQDQQMSKENAEQILEALQQDEKATQDRINKEQMKQVRQKITEKDW